MFKPRMIIKKGAALKQESVLESQTMQAENQRQLSSEEISLRLRQPRSEAYMQAISRLDAGGTTMNSHLYEEIKDILREEMGDRHLFDILLGIVAVCHLGGDYEVHTLDLNQNIIYHYRAGEAMPDGLEKARNLALFGGYTCVEVYQDCCRGIYEDGTVSVIR